MYCIYIASKFYFGLNRCCIFIFTYFLKNLYFSISLAMTVCELLAIFFVSSKYAVLI